MHVSETHFAPFALPALLCAESLVMDTPNVQRTIYCGRVHLQAMQQDAVNHAKKCRCSGMGRHDGDVEDGKMTREEAIKLLKQYQGYEPMFPDGETLKHAFDLMD